MDSYNQNSIRHKSGLLNLAAELGNILKACRIMGVSRDIFYRYQAAQDTGRIEAIFNVRRCKPKLKNRMDEITEEAVVQFAAEYPSYGQARTSKEPRKRGIFVSPSGVCSIWLRHGLSNFKQRLSGLEKKSATLLNIPKARRVIPRQMASANASTRPFCRDFIRLRSGINCTILLMRCKRIWTSDCTNIIWSERTKAKWAVDGLPCKPCLTARLYGMKRPDS